VNHAITILGLDAKWSLRILTVFAPTETDATAGFGTHVAVSSTRMALSLVIHCLKLCSDGKYDSYIAAYNVGVTFCSLLLVAILTMSIFGCVAACSGRTRHGTATQVIILPGAAPPQQPGVQLAAVGVPVQ